MNDDQLARLIREAADQVQPRPALDAIRARTATAPKESAMTLARTWILGGLSGAVATAAVIGGVYFVTTGGDDNDPGPGPADTPSGTVTGSPSPTPTETAEPTPSETASEVPAGGKPVAVPVYYVGDTPDGARLYREFQQHKVLDPSDARRKVTAAVAAAVGGKPMDSDYRSPWPAGTTAAVEHEVDVPDVITINVESADAADGGLHDRPSGMTAETAELAIQQLVYTAQAAYGQGRMPVQLLLDGGHSDQILGVPTSEPLANGPVLDTLALVNISTPSDGAAITGDKLEVTGVGNSFEANIVVKLQRFEGTHVVFQEPLTAEGWMGEKLFPFSGSFDISTVPAGRYILTAVTDDPSGGAEGNGPHVDSKVIEIK